MMELIELVRCAKTGDIEAQGALYEASYKKVYYLALRLTKNSEDAEDAVQEAFIAAFSALPNLQNDNAFEGWLFQIVANKCRNKLSRTKQTAELPEDFAEHTPDPNDTFLPEAVLQDAEKRRLILEIIDNLSDAQRECVMLFYYSELSVKQIAEILACSEGTVKSRLNYARQKIKDGILETEDRDGIRLHVFVPFGLFLAQDFAYATAGLTIPELGSAAGVSFAANETTAAGGAKAGLFATLKAKIIAGGTAAVILAGGAMMYHDMQRAPENKSEGIQAISLAEVTDNSEKSTDLDEELFAQPISFEDTGMEDNIRILLEIPENEPITREDLISISQVGFIDSGMNFFDGQNWLGNGRIEAAPGTVPVESFVDLQYFGGGDCLVISIFNPSYSVDLDQIRETVPYVMFEYHDGRGPQP